MSRTVQCGALCPMYVPTQSVFCDSSVSEQGNKNMIIKKNKGFGVIFV